MTLFYATAAWKDTLIRQDRYPPYVGGHRLRPRSQWRYGVHRYERFALTEGIAANKPTEATTTRASHSTASGLAAGYEGRSRFYLAGIESGRWLRLPAPPESPEREERQERAVPADRCRRSSWGYELGPPALTFYRANQHPQGVSGPGVPVRVRSWWHLRAGGGRGFSLNCAACSFEGEQDGNAIEPSETAIHSTSEDRDPWRRRSW